MKDLVPYFIKNDSLLRDPYAVSKIQIDFGTDIGTLRKVRFEIDGAGDKPNFYLEYVEAQDLDTKERCVIMVHNWLLVGAIQGHRKWQPFREISLFMQSYMPLKNRTYEGTVTLGDQSMIVDDDTPIFLQCFNEGTEEDQPDFDTSGIFPVVPTKMKNKSIVRKDVLCAFNLLEDVYDAMSLRDGIPTDVFRMGKNLFVEEILHKEGDHIPHVMRYQTSNIDYEENNTKGPYFKNFFPRDSWPTSTERKRKKSAMKKIEEFSNWELLMSFLLKTGNPDIPNVELVTKDERTFEMECERKFEEGGALLRYKLTAPNFGNPFKCRVSLPQETPNTKTHIRKMILTELNTKTQIFFTVDKEFSGNSTEELPCTYPDIGIKEINDYEVNITTIEGGGNFRPYINIHGDGGDTGYRPYPGDKSFTLSPRTIDKWANCIIIFGVQKKN
uniref:PLAT domain-containing protein n=1 Tax=Caenorhabditis tropicalis TaxID=1561998 RepID=A0A1I7UY24_9PELO